MRRLPLVLLAALAVAGCGGRTDAFQHFQSRPDLSPPAITVTTPAHGTEPGYIFIAPKPDDYQAGPMILDDSGTLVWFKRLDTHAVTDFRVQLYRGKPVLTWWRGRAVMGIGNGYDVITDDSYREIARVRAGNGLIADVHEFKLTPRNTALITIYHRVPMDLSSVGGPRDGKIEDGIVQEVEISSGRVLFVWHSMAEVGLDESYYPPPDPKKGKTASPWDYFHVNSVDEDADGNLLVSARNTHTLYKIDRTTGRIAWRLGGKKSDFTMGPGTTFGWQHDARWRPGGTISLFDNEANPPLAKQSRGLVLRVDEAARTVSLVREYTHPGGLLSGSQGNVQYLPDGHVFIGWGANPNFTEYDADGRVVFDAHFTMLADSYRAYRLPWSGHPKEPPALALLTDRRGRVAAYASWNGATDVARWQVLAGPDDDHLRQVASTAKTGFETEVDLGYLLDRRLAVRAVGANGERLGTSPVETRPAR